MDEDRHRPIRHPDAHRRVYLVSGKQKTLTSTPSRESFRTWPTGRQLVTPETDVSDEYTGLKHAFQGAAAVFVHGQKKRRKRTLEGSIPVDGRTLSWSLLSEPLWSTEHGYVGLRIAVRAEDEAHRELILEYPYPKTKGGSALPLPQRPSVSAKRIEADVREAIAAGWDPNSRGKAFVHSVISSITSEDGKPEEG